MEAYDNLKNAIVLQAAEDYAAAFMGNRVGGKEPSAMIRDCENFFHSDWYASLTNDAVNGDWLARNVKIRELEKAAKAYEAILDTHNRATFRAAVSFSQEKGKTKPMTYIFPPKFAGDIMDVLRIQLEGIKTEIRKLQTENEEVDT